MIKVIGYSTGLYGWMERIKRDGGIWDWSSLYRACAESGVDAVETDPTPEKLQIVREYGMSVSSSYIGKQLHLKYAELDADRTILPVADRLAAAGGRDLLLNADPGEGKKSEDDFKRQGENMSLIAERVTAMGLKVSMHNHASDLYHAEGDLRSVIDYASLQVGLCIDAAWAHVAGCDPVEWIRRYPERIYSFHLRNQRGAVPSEDLLEGELSMPAVLKAAADAGYEGWLTLELWHPDTMTPVRTMREDVERSIQYLKETIRKLGQEA